MNNKRKTVSVVHQIDEGSEKNKKVLKNIRAQVIGVQKRQNVSDKSQSLDNDPFSVLEKNGRIIEPPFNILTLAMLIENNTEMRPVLDALVTNISGYGHRFVPRIKLPKADEETRKIVESERVRLENFFAYATKETFVEFRKRQDLDLEQTGNSYFEVIRNVKGGVQGFTHLPSYQVRLGFQEKDWQLVDRSILELQEDLSVKVVKRKEYRRFRSFCQSKQVYYGDRSEESRHNVSWFKEFGDPRIYDARTGFLSDESLEVKYRANELVHRQIYSTRSPYGLPRYIGNLFSIYGDRASEEINYKTFKNNNIPSMVVAVSNGQLTEGSIQRIESFVESSIAGSDNFSKFLILEAEGAEDEPGEDGSQVKLDIKPLVSEQHKDALFQEYSRNNVDKIRRAWRIPPIFTGSSGDYSRNVADTSRRLADEQIFEPKRTEWDELFNRDLFPTMGIRYHKYKSNSPNTTDNQQLVSILSGSEKTGGMTPRIARIMLEEILSKELPDFVGDFEPDVPFSLTMAEAVKNQADPVEPGQQVTAIKNIEDSAKRFFEIADIVEKNWRKIDET